MNRLMRILAVMSAMVSNFGQIACKSDSPTTPDTAQLIVRAVTPIQLSGIVGSFAQESPAVQVASARTQRPIANVEVRFTGPSVSQPLALTDANGIASAGQWQFSKRPGTEWLSVWVGGKIELQFAARLRHDVPALVYGFGVSNNELVALAGHRVPAFEFQVFDQFGNGVDDLRITFSVSTGTFDGVSVVTDRAGRAFAGSWLLDKKPGTGELTLSAAGMPLKVFLGQGVDSTSITWYSLRGDNGTPRSRIGFSNLDKCLCGEQQGYFLDQFGSGIYDVAEHGGRFTRTERNVRLTWPYGSGRFEGDSLFVEKFDSVDGETFDPVYITWVYVVERN